MKKLISLILFAALLCGLSACAQPPARYEAEFLVLFNTVTRIIGYAKNKEEFTRQAQAIYALLEEYHQLYDIYNDYPGVSNIKTINDSAGIAPVQVDQRIVDMLIFAREQYARTSGRVNIAMGAALKIWHDYRERGVEDPESAELPPREALIRAAEHCDIHQLIIDAEHSTVYLSDPEMSLDVGAVAKGYAVEQAARLAVKNGFVSGVISVGGNVRTIGQKPDGGKWNVGVQDPSGAIGADNLLIVSLSGQSLVSSGAYERYYTVGGRDYHHIIDPDTLYPSEYFTAVSVLAWDSGLADALSTAVFNLPLKEGRALIDGAQDVEAVWVLPDGSVEYSAHFQDYIKP